MVFFLKPFWFKGHSASTSSVYNDIMIVIEFPRWLFEGRPRQGKKSAAIFRGHWGNPKQADGSWIGNLGLKFDFLNIHFYQYFSLLLRKLSKFWYKMRVPVVWLLTQYQDIVHISNGYMYVNNIFGLFITNSFTSFTLKMVPEVKAWSINKFMDIGGDWLATGFLGGIHGLYLGLST